MTSIVYKKACFLNIGDQVMNLGEIKDKQSLSNGYVLLRFNDDRCYMEFWKFRLIALSVG